MVVMVMFWSQSHTAAWIRRSRFETCQMRLHFCTFLFHSCFTLSCCCRETSVWLLVTMVTTFTSSTALFLLWHLYVQQKGIHCPLLNNISCWNSQQMLPSSISLWPYVRMWQGGSCIVSPCDGETLFQVILRAAFPLHARKQPIDWPAVFTDFSFLCLMRVCVFQWPCTATDCVVVPNLRKVMWELLLSHSKWSKTLDLFGCSSQVCEEQMDCHSSFGSVLAIGSCRVHVVHRFLSI